MRSNDDMTTYNCKMISDLDDHDCEHDHNNDNCDIAQTPEPLSTLRTHKFLNS